MTNKNKRKKTHRAHTSTGPGTARPGPATTRSGPVRDEARRERKQMAREARAAARKRAARDSFVRRAAVFSVVGLVGVGAFYFLTKADGPGSLPQAAVAAAEAAGCTEVTQPAGGNAQAGVHVDEGVPLEYAQKPATSGEHYGGQVLPSSPDSYDEPITSEPAAVHFLEHSGVMLYYRASGDGAASPEVIDALKGVAATSPMTIAAPYDGLAEGTTVALAAWNQLQTCPGEQVTADQATTIAGGFAEAFACSTNAPEPNAADDDSC
ncbi:MAG: DUF3105 domain-containing protein [Actinobacteria bacterium]|nr:DUF3105 domain-containing protein [Actinomycetota bacterium]